VISSSKASSYLMKNKIELAIPYNTRSIPVCARILFSLVPELLNRFMQIEIEIGKTKSGSKK
jgi:hypothetical protein